MTTYDRERIVQDCFSNFLSDGREAKFICQNDEIIHLPESIVRLFSGYLNKVIGSNSEGETVILMPDVPMSTIQHVKDLFLYGQSKITTVEDHYKVQETFNVLLGFGFDDLFLELEIKAEYKAVPIDLTTTIKSEHEEYHECERDLLVNTQVKLEVKETDGTPNFPFSIDDILDDPLKKAEECNLESPPLSELISNPQISEETLEVDIESEEQAILDTSAAALYFSDGELCPESPMRDSTPTKEAKSHRSHEGERKDKRTEVEDTPNYPFLIEDILVDSLKGAEECDLERPPLDRNELQSEQISNRQTSEETSKVDVDSEDQAIQDTSVTSGLYLSDGELMPESPIEDLRHDYRTPSPFINLDSTPPKQASRHRSHKGERKRRRSTETDKIRSSSKSTHQNTSLSNQAPISKLPELQYIYERRYCRHCGRSHTLLDVCAASPAHSTCGRKHGYAINCDGTWMSLQRYEAMALRWGSTLQYKRELEEKRHKVSKVKSTCIPWNLSGSCDGCSNEHRCSFMEIDNVHGDRVCWGRHRERDHAAEKNRRFRKNGF